MKRVFNLLLTVLLTAALSISAASYSYAENETNDGGFPAFSNEEEGIENDAGLSLPEDLSLPEEEIMEENAEGSWDDPQSDELFTEELPDEETAEETLLPDGETQGSPDEDTQAVPEEEDEFEVIEPAKEEAGKYELSSVKLAHAVMTYSGKARTQSSEKIVVEAIVDEETVVLTPEDYKVTYKNNVNIGIATVVFEGIGDYTGTIEKTFKIIPSSTSFQSADVGNKCLALKWKKQARQTTGYQIQYAKKNDFSDKTNIWIKKNTTVSKTITGLASGSQYYVRIRVYAEADGTKYYSKWSEVTTAKLLYNGVKVTGSGTKRTVTLLNPKSSVTSARVCIWSDKGGSDDKKWYTMKKQVDGSWKATILLGYLKNYGSCIARCYNGDTYLRKQAFNVSKADFQASKNTVVVTGSGSTRKVTVLRPSGIKNAKVAVWSDKNQKDLTWYTMKKQSNGTWAATIKTLPLIRVGTCEAHVWANKQTKYIGEATFSNKLTDRSIVWNTSWEFAGYSKVHTGTAKLYRAKKNRKGIVVGINSGHGTILPAGQDNYVWSHPDHTPKVTGGSTAAGAVKTICDNSGMTFTDGTPEAHVTLQQGLILKDVLLNAGYDVIVIRENNDSGLDVIARTVICNNLADCHISLHWDGDGLGYDKGIYYMSVPNALKSMYPTSTIWSESNRLGDSVIKGMKKKGLRIFESGSMQMDLMQTSYSKVPSIDIELGNQSSTHTSSDLKKRAEGMLAGLNIFFGQS